MAQGLHVREHFFGKENLVAAGCVAVGILITLGGAQIESDYYKSVAANMGTGLVGLGIGIVLVNVYFGHQARRKAIEPLLGLIEPSLRRHHNEFLSEVHTYIGKADFDNLLNQYANGDGDPLAISADMRTKLYEIIKAKKAHHDLRLQTLDSELKELLFILGWQFDATIMENIVACRLSISGFSTTQCGDDPKSVAAICEHFLNIAFLAHSIFDALITIAGRQQDEVYGDSP